MQVKFKLISLIAVIVLNACKKEHLVEKNSSIASIYKEVGLEYLTTVKSEDYNVLPLFAGIVQDKESIKILYAEEQNNQMVCKSCKYENGQKQTWDVPATIAYYNWSKIYLSIDGSLIVNGESTSIIEKGENDFSVMKKVIDENNSDQLLKINKKIIGYSFKGDDSEVSGYQGNLYNMASLQSDYNSDMTYNQKKLISDKMWNFDLQEFTNDNLLFTYTKGDLLYVSLLNSNFEKTIIDSKQLEGDYLRNGGSCDYSIQTGNDIYTIKNKKNPYFYFGYRGNYHSKCLYQLKDEKLVCVDDKLERTNLFAFNDQLYAKDSNYLELFNNGRFTKIDFGSNITILKIFGDEQGILLAVKRKDIIEANYFDLVRYQP
ncbi:MAG: hypothetical protein PSX81_09370 [bacterium]|nr:hypothetical protein [bacterium]